MTGAQASDRHDPWTLRFLDSDLERAYQHADLAEGIRRVRAASFGAILVWLLLAIVGPPTIGVRPEFTWLICATMVLVLVTGVALTRLAATQRQRDAIGLGQQLAACVAALVLCLGNGLLDRYGMPAVMLTAVFGFSVTRHPFVGSVAVGAAYCLLFAGFGLAAGLTTQLPLQLMIVAATVGAACGGAYLLERSQRVAFAQARLVATLHERVDLLLHQYLSPAVASALIEDPDQAALGGREVEVTVLFADLRGFTTFSERRTPTEVVGMLNAAFGEVVPIVLAEGGTVVQFMGDALMAIFNAPIPQADHALRAARAALRMQRAVDALPGAEDRPRFRVGLNTGPALVGNIGAAAVRNYSAIGDTTNLAARLQTWAPEGSVVIGFRTYELIRNHASVRPLGSPALKGKADAVDVYELIGLRDDAGARP